MRIDDKIWSHPSNCRKGHINIRPQLRADALLPMSAAKFVTYYRVSGAASSDIHLQTKVRAIFLASKDPQIVTHARQAH